MINFFIYTKINGEQINKNKDFRLKKEIKRYKNRPTNGMIKLIYSQ